MQVGAAGRLHAHSCQVSGAAAYLGAEQAAADEAASAAAAERWMEEEAAVCRSALGRIVRSWKADEFEIRSTSISFSSTPQLPDTHTDMLRQALRALCFLEQDGSRAKSSSRRSKASADKAAAARLQKFVDSDMQNVVLELEKQVLLRGMHLDGLRSAASSHVRHHLSTALASIGHNTLLHEESGFPAIKSAVSSSSSSSSLSSSATAKAGWLYLPTATAIVNIYGKLDFLDCLPALESRSHSSPHLSHTPPATAGGGGGSSSGVSAQVAAAVGVAPRVLNVKWRIWEEQMLLLHSVAVLPLAADVWQVIWNSILICACCVWGRA